MKEKVLLSLSGGMDSSVLLSWLLYNQYDVQAVSFFYGSKHNQYENPMAQKLCDYYKVPWTLLNLSSVFQGFRSSLMKEGEAIPEGHYTDETMSSTVVPSRNIIFLSLLSGVAWSHDIPQIALAIHSGDHAIYPDCRPEFYKSMDLSLFLGTGGRVQIMAPFVNMDKKDLVQLGHTLGTPFELTRTCYKDQEIACGKCGSCVERLEAFSLNGLKDPLSYE